jgi:hypothetical protein
MKSTTLVILLTCSIHLFAQQEVTHDAYTKLLKKYVSSGGKVNYKGFIQDSVKLNSYLKYLSKHPPQKRWSRNEQMDYYPVKSIKDIGSKIQIPFVNTPWDMKFITIGKDKLDLNNIEHGILRKRFDDPRIHMTLVCASKSCPVLLNEAYEPDKLEAQLEQQSRAFLADEYRNQISADAPQLSMLFKWYSMDFNENGKTVRDFINRYSAVKIKPNAKVSYLEYNWNLNE